MFRATTQTIVDSMKGIPRSWDTFWFEPMEAARIARVRQAFAIWIGIWFIACFFWVPTWLTQDGWFGIDAGRYFIGLDQPGTGSQYRWSILFWLHSKNVATVLCLAGALSCIGMFFGVAGRWTILIAWTCMMMVHHRAPWLSLSAEWLAWAALIYLALGPVAPPWRGRSVELLESKHTVLANVALRCIQIHWLIWLGGSLASMFSQAPWWDGSAIAILSEQNALGFGKLSRDGWTSQIAGFLFLALHPLTILCLIVREHRGVGILLTGLLGLSYGVFAGDWMFCGIACCYAVAFVPVSPPKKI